MPHRGRIEPGLAHRESHPDRVMTTTRTGKTVAPTGGAPVRPGPTAPAALTAGKGETQMADEVSPQYPLAVREQRAAAAGRSASSCSPPCR